MVWGEEEGSSWKRSKGTALRWPIASSRQAAVRLLVNDSRPACGKDTGVQERECFWPLLDTFPALLPVSVEEGEASVEIWRGAGPGPPVNPRLPHGKTLTWVIWGLQGVRLPEGVAVEWGLAFQAASCPISQNLVPEFHSGGASPRPPRSPRDPPTRDCPAGRALAGQLLRKWQPLSSRLWGPPCLQNSRNCYQWTSKAVSTPHCAPPTPQSRLGAWEPA